jgi:DNA invertase Pin-like site-specific DNA recombinase
MLNDASRRHFDIVLVWAIDRLGRSLIDLLGTIKHLEAVGCDLFIDQQNIDTSTLMGKLIFSVCGAFAQFERSIIQQRIHAGLTRARAQGKVLGRPKVDEATESAIVQSLRKGVGIKKTAAMLGCGIGTVLRVRNEASA